MRQFLSVLTLLAVLAGIGLWIDDPDPVCVGAAPAHSSARGQADPWRRTLKGWERCDAWGVPSEATSFPPTVATVARQDPISEWPLPNPLLIVVFQVVTSLTALILFGQQENPG